MSNVEKDDPARRALVNEIVGTTEGLAETIGDPGYRSCSSLLKRERRLAGGPRNYSPTFGSSSGILSISSR